MGLDMSHDCWSGGCTSFYRFRTLIAMLAGMPSLGSMEGYCGYAAIRWDSLKPDVLHELLNHSDCDGDIQWERCSDLADRLEEIKGAVDETVTDPEDGMPDFIGKLDMMIKGLMSAYECKENILFR